MPVLRLPPLPTAAAAASTGKQTWSGLHGAALPLAIAEAASGAQRFTLLLTTDSQSADRLEQELRFFAPHLPVLHFPDWETLPYDLFSPHQDIVSQRIASLYRLPELAHGVLVVPITTALHRLAPTQFLLGSSLVLDVGQKLDVEQTRARLEAAGYRYVDTVYEHGEFTVRGALIDLFPMGSRLPYRIDLFDDEIETLRTFDPETQRSVDKVESVRLLPAREFPLQKDAVTRFKARFRERFDVDFRKSPIFQDLNSGITPAGIEYYLPLFFENTATLFDYLPEGTQVISLPGIEQAAEQFWSDVRGRFEERRIDPMRPLLPPAELFLPVEDCFARLKAWPRVVAGREVEGAKACVPCEPLPDLAIEAKASQPMSALANFLDQFPGRVLFTAESAGRREVLLELLERLKLRPKGVDSWAEFAGGEDRLAITLAPLEEGLCLRDPALALVPESPLFGQRVMQRRRRDKRNDASNDAVIKNLTELREGAPVVHIDHGVGRYLGLATLEIDNQAAEFLTLAYADDAKLYVPVANLHLIARYTGSDDALAPLHKLGSEAWQKAKRKAAEQVRDVAAELLDIYARRAARKGHAFADPALDYQTFSAGFAFEETPDQYSAIEAVRADMLAPKPMDRLVCGDVGFGKTEVAMRAAFIAVHSGRQVAVLVPTTLLAQQHYNSFRDRFADWPVRVEVMSRFKSAKEVDAAVAELAEGKIDIVIGTHKLLSEDVKFKQLGLAIIDEEHRFGVRQKEQLKALRSEVDILTLTATPIPRTLNMAMSGMRDLSIIATPPARRLSVRTFVMEQNKSTIKEALLRELLRGGQVYFLHNDVKTIEKCAADLAELVPEARIGIGHGQMRERELEQVMSDFYHKRFNVLVASTIIETGIDVPSANTIIIERADKFGLAQLHQLRGRVGRSHHQAYAYLLTPPRQAITPDAEKRLEAIANTQDLGAGFVLATNDLEIRGAGELLGDGQSGQIQAVGFTLYMEMLERAVKAIQKGEQPNLEQPLGGGPDINLRLPALIPDDYLPDVHARLILYKRIASAADEEGLKDLQVEMIDRFGLLPDPTKNLMRLTLLKLRAEQLGIVKIDAGPQGGRIEFGAQTPVDPLVLIKLIQGQPNRYKFEGATLFRFSVPMERADERFNTLEALLERLAPKAG
ncbi:MULTISPECIES: transcription-repair coupling factor [unclassified Pseudomonas]|uniref:transcription-repair coupling factor n=1 Tax=unclassified Pseudomonas TaxID=196821 RepID=UPI000BCEBF37|nr:MULTISPECIES: transcription-repair coupling factor [unclassified Pseudomonas]PVZ20432.1 transcription-repair coupling factor (superfamily II helicase) [Pseudomonas sp. URIL14HWK12:I12]PVZ27498.1 transcription-repair coupling factor (superfamily II helicase) [Pseudomonas sp. URIL14HWK12:I10]PVZ38387.1 transcription-repair coupling factor (superfamily II helicase) [Pseudomonas sp. URIL14HWK12:I11]SNZ03560.1 transcription-repair coupling factor (superfamily II helicase) [Pseudomonas sp. URIL14H